MLAAPPLAAAPQAPPGGPPADLASLQQAAIDRDPRVEELDLEAQAAELRLANVAALRRPAVGVDGRAQYQSDVPHAPFTTPTGAPLFAVAKDTYDATVRVDAPLLDPTVEPRLAVERARRDEAQARVRTALYGLRQEVNAAFFAAALTDGHLKVLEAATSDLEARLNEARARVREGAAIPAEAAAIEAVLLERQQDAAEASAARDAAFARLSDLTGLVFGADSALEMPDLATAVGEARANLDALRARPEFAQFERSRELLQAQEDAAAASDRPRVSAFGTAGFGRPGLNFVDDAFEGYWLAGVRVQWTAWDRGTSGRDRDVLDKQQAIVAAEEAAFAARVRRGVEDDLTDIDRLAAAGAQDDRIVALREQVVRSAGAQFDEGALTGADYANRNTDLVNAQLARGRHRVELAQARARFLTTLGLEVR